jgi:hypothetical protein
MSGHDLYLVGGAPRVGKSALAQRLLRADGIPWLPTDVVRTVLRRVLPELDAVDQDPVDAARQAEVMYPHIEQAAQVCAEEAGQFLIEGFELSPSHPARLQAALAPITVRACFLGHATFSPGDLASYRGPKPQHERRLSAAELGEARPGSPSAAINCATSARWKASGTSTWVRWASTSPCSKRAAISWGPARHAPEQQPMDANPARPPTPAHPYSRYRLNGGTVCAACRAVPTHSQYQPSAPG